MYKKKGLLLRTIPVAKFNYFLDELNRIMDINECDLLVQENVINQIDNKYKLNLIPIKPGRMNFFSGLKYFNIFNYEKVIIPVNSFEFEEYVNLLFFSATNIAKKYYLVYPDYTYKEFGFLKLIGEIIFFMIIETIVFFVLILVIPFLIFNILYNRLKYFIKNKKSNLKG